MKNCSKCGEEILENAKKCKHCSADLRNWFVRHPIYSGLFLIVALSILGSAFAPQQTEEQKEEIRLEILKAESEKIEKEKIVISATELSRAYDDNEIKSDELYKNQYLEVAGTISSIGKGFGDSMYIVMNGHDFLKQVQCTLKEEAKKEIVKYAEGNSIKVIGEGNGMSLGSVMLKNCTVTE